MKYKAIVAFIAAVHKAGVVVAQSPPTPVYKKIGESCAWPANKYLCAAGSTDCSYGRGQYLDTVKKGPRESRPTCIGSDIPHPHTCCGTIDTVAAFGRALPSYSTIADDTTFGPNLIEICMRVTQQEYQVVTVQGTLAVAADVKCTTDDVTAGTVYKEVSTRCLTPNVIKIFGTPAVYCTAAEVKAGNVAMFQGGNCVKTTGIKTAAVPATGTVSPPEIKCTADDITNNVPNALGNACASTSEAKVTGGINVLCDSTDVTNKINTQSSGKCLATTDIKTPPVPPPTCTQSDVDGGTQTRVSGFCVMKTDIKTDAVFCSQADITNKVKDANGNTCLAVTNVKTFAVKCNQGMINNNVARTAANGDGKCQYLSDIKGALTPHVACTGTDVSNANVWRWSTGVCGADTEVKIKANVGVVETATYYPVKCILGASKLGIASAILAVSTYMMA